MGVAWSEPVSRDVAGSREFYTELLGRTAAEIPGANGSYTLFREDGEEVAGPMAPPDAAVPAPMRFTYLAVADVDASVARVGALGGKALRAPFDVPNVGRIAVVADPGGAAVGLYRAAGAG